MIRHVLAASALVSGFAPAAFAAKGFETVDEGDRRPFAKKGGVILQGKVEASAESAESEARASGRETVEKKTEASELSLGPGVTYFVSDRIGLLVAAVLARSREDNSEREWTGSTLAVGVGVVYYAPVSEALYLGLQAFASGVTGSGEIRPDDGDRTKTRLSGSSLGAAVGLARTVGDGGLFEVWAGVRSKDIETELDYPSGAEIDEVTVEESSTSFSLGSTFGVYF